MKIELTTEEAVITKVLLENFAKQTANRLAMSGTYPHAKITTRQEIKLTSHLEHLQSALAKFVTALTPVAQEPIAQKRKGEFEGTCNVSSCTTWKPAIWYNHSTQKYYCETCADRLNHDSKALYFAAKEYGHELCTFGEKQP